MVCSIVLLYFVLKLYLFPQKRFDAVLYNGVVGYTTSENRRTYDIAHVYISLRVLLYIGHDLLFPFPF